MKRVICYVLMLVTLVGLLTACGEKKLSDAEYLELAKDKAEQNKKTVGLYVTKGDKTYEVTMDYLVYFLAYNEQQGLEYREENKDYFNSVYKGEYDYWSVLAGNGETIKQTFKNRAFATAAYSSIMYFEAMEAGYELEPQRLAQLDQLTADFMAKYTAEEKARGGLTEEIIRASYERILIADAYEKKLASEIVVDEEEVAASVDKEDYRVYVTDYLYVSKNDYADDFSKVELTPDQMAERVNAIEDALAQAEKGQTMASLQAKYADFMTYATRDFYRTNNTYESMYMQAAMKLEVGECVLKETDTGYYVIKLIDNTQYVGYEDAIQAAIDAAETADKADIYTEIEKEYEIETATGWDAVELGNFILKKAQ